MEQSVDPPYLCKALAKFIGIRAHIVAKRARRADACRIHQHEPVEQTGILRSKQDRNPASEGVADEVASAQPHGFNELARKRRIFRHPPRLRRLRRLPKARKIHGHSLIAEFAHAVHDGAHRLDVRTPSVQDQHGPALSHALIMNVYAFYFTKQRVFAPFLISFSGFGTFPRSLPCCSAAHAQKPLHRQAHHV